MENKNNYQYSLWSPQELAAKLAERVQKLRLLRGWKQSTLAERSGVKIASLRRFEQTGKASFNNLLRLALALGRMEEFDALFQPPPASSIAELEMKESQPKYLRGRK